jgi:hypothetical protein
MDLQTILRNAGSMANSYLNDVGTATSGGAGNDLLSFIQQNFQDYGQKMKTSTEQRSQIFDQLAKGETPDPTLLHQMISEASSNSPVSGVLGPIGRVTAEATGSAGGAKAVNAAQKKIIKALFRGDPQTLKDVVAAPEMLHVGVPGAGSNLPTAQSQNLVNQVMGGAFAHLQPGRLSSTMRVDPNVMRGLDPVTTAIRNSAVKARSPILKSQGVEGLPDMVVHEATHFLNEPKLGNEFITDASKRFGIPAVSNNAEDLITALQPFIGHAKFGPGITTQHLVSGNPGLAVNEGLSYLSQPTGRSPAATYLNNALQGRERGLPINAFDKPTQDLLQEALMAALRVPGAMR